jgi:acetate kinase
MTKKNESVENTEEKEEKTVSIAVTQKELEVIEKMREDHKAKAEMNRLRMAGQKIVNGLFGFSRKVTVTEEIRLDLSCGTYYCIHLPIGTQASIERSWNENKYLLETKECSVELELEEVGEYLKLTEDDE